MNNEDLQDKLNLLRKKADIVEVIGSYLPLIKKGKDYKCVCPFHNDTSPSLSINPEKQIFKCFACGHSGNVITFVKDYEKVNFMEAVEILAKRYGLENEFNIKHEESKYQPYYNTMDIANLYFQNNLQSEEGTNARKYLYDRKLDDETIKEFQIGLSLKERDKLTKLFLNQGKTLEELNELDLSNTDHDTYINRIIFPLHDTKGNVIGFSGRIYNNEDLNKYQNTKETVIFKKGENLFNYYRAKNSIQEDNYVILMEGFMAVIRSFTVGIKNCVAAMGTALTQKQIDLLKRLSKNIYICYDGDNAGYNATLKNGDLLLKNGINPKVIKLSDNLDPDDYIIKYGGDSFKELIKKAIDYTEYKIINMKSSYNLSNIEDKTKYINDVLKQISLEKDEIKVELSIKSLEKETDVCYNTLVKRLNEFKTNNSKVEKEEIIEKEKKKYNKYLKALYAVIFYMLNYEEAIKVVDNYDFYTTFEEISDIISQIKYFYNKFGYVNEADFMTFIEGNEKYKKIYEEVFDNNYPSVFNIQNLKDNIDVCLKYSKALEVKELEEKVRIETDFQKKAELLDRMRMLKMKEG